MWSTLHPAHGWGDENTQSSLEASTPVTWLRAGHEQVSESEMISCLRDLTACLRGPPVLTPRANSFEGSLLYTRGGIK